MSFDEDDIRRTLNARSVPPSPEFRGRLSAALQEGRPGRDQMPRLAAVAAIMLAVAAAGVLVFIRGAGTTPMVTPGGKPSPGVTASAPSSPSPTASSRSELPVPGILTRPPEPIALPGEAILSAPTHEVVWALVVGQYLYRSTDDGGSWTQRPLPPFAGQGIEISFVSASEGWLSALSSPETQCNAQGIAIWHTTDAGSTWYRLPVAGIADAQCKYGLSFIDARHGFVGAYDPNGRAVIYRTADGGSTWTPSAMLADPPGFKSQAGGWYLEAWQVKSFGTELLVPVTQSNPSAVRIYVSGDGGATWTYSATAPNIVELPAFVTATRWLQLIVPGQSQETTDGGRTWHVAASDYQQAAPIAPVVVFADA